MLPADTGMPEIRKPTGDYSTICSAIRILLVILQKTQHNTGMKFEDVVGQEETIGRLRQMAADGRIPHALLLCGPSGCGKMALATAFASHILGDSPLLRNLNHPDLHFTYPTVKLPSMGSDHQPVSDDFAREWRELMAHGPYFTLEQWMTAIGATTQQAVITGAESDSLSRKLSMKSSQGGHKVCIVWLPERMNPTSANKLLKLLEEPPSRTIFILVSEEPGQLLETIRSRTQRIDVKRIGASEMENALVEKRGIERDTARRIARVAGGSWMKAISTLDADNENRLFFDMFTLLMRHAYKRDLKELKKWGDSAAGFGREKQKRMLTYFGRMVRENFMYNFRTPELNYMTEEEEKFASRFSPFVNEANVIGIAEMLEKARRDVAQNANGRIVFFELALQTIILLNKRP